ncbi:hypothetical protein ACQBAT_00235 [Ornithinimicrobium sp. Y1847]|uniref:hypothetical protein n=1 Tax=Ornithinimicrobium sp. Y1847 TaxID=3405419 RepID=UPI003B66F8BB
MPAEPTDPDVTPPRLTFLGPQRDPRLDSVVRNLGLEGGTFATITAGWRDRESDDGLLDEQLGGRSTNLHLWGLMQQVWDADPELEQADRERRARLGELQALYLIGLEQAAEALWRIQAATIKNEDIRDVATLDAVRIMREMDEQHLERVDDLHREFYERFQPQHRDAVVTARFAVGRAISQVDAVVITGGHVGVLLGALHLFNLGPALSVPEVDEDGVQSSSTRLHRPIIAWGAGAMALTERVLLFYDNSATSPGVSEMLMRGLGLTRDVVALPSPKDRLDMKNEQRMRKLVARLAPARALLLDGRAEVTLTPEGQIPPGARLMGEDGTPCTYEGEESA